MRRNIGTALAVAIAILVHRPACAGGKAEGGCVSRNTAGGNLAPVYRSESGSKIEAKADIGDCVAGITTMGPLHEYLFERKNGRVHVLYIPTANQIGNERTAWMDEADLSFFTYECGCGAGRDQHPEEDCSPLAKAGFMDRTWNPCFKEARDKKLAELKSGGASQSANSPPSSTEKALTNEDILSLVKVGLGDELIVGKVRQAKTVAFDLSTDGLVALKKAGVPNAVIDAMMKRSAK